MITTRLCELFGIAHPILNAPMAGGGDGRPGRGGLGGRGLWA